MFPNISISQIDFAAFGTICLFVIIAAFVYGKKLMSTWGRTLSSTMTPAMASSHKSASHPASDAFPPLIDRPADPPAEQNHFFGQPQEESAFSDFTEDEEEEGTNFLLLEAEKVVERIQTMITNIESSPANPEEVKSKLKAIVSQYRIFVNTEYYEAINSFIAISVQRDCDLRLEESELHYLWMRQVA